MKIRNLDVLESKLAEKKGKEGVAGMHKGIRREREKSVRRSMKVAWALFEVRTPRVDKKELAGFGTSVSKVLNDLGTVIGAEATRGGGCLDQGEKMHSIRKRCNKFGYNLC